MIRDQRENKINFDDDFVRIVIAGRPRAERLGGGGDYIFKPTDSMQFWLVDANHGSEFVNRDVAAVIKAHNLIDIKTRPRHPESNGIVERFNGTVRQESGDHYGGNYVQAEEIVAKLIHHYNDERLHAALGYMAPVIWHRARPKEVREEGARRIAAARAQRKQTNQQRFVQASSSGESLPF